MRAEFELITVVSVIIFVLSVFGTYIISTVIPIIEITDININIFKAIAILSLAMAMYAVSVGVTESSKESENEVVK